MSCLEFALNTDERLYRLLESYCEKLLAQLITVANDPKSLD